MKLSKVAAAFKPSKTARIVVRTDENGEIKRQFVTNGAALYPLDGLPMLDEQSILSVFDIPKDKQSEWITKVESANESEFLKAVLEDNDDSDTEIHHTGMMFDYMDTTMIAYFSQSGVVFLNANYIKPIANEGDSIGFYTRKTISGNIIVAKTGFLLIAVIMPVNVMHGDFVEKLSTIAASLDAEFAQRKADAERQEEREARMSLPTGQERLPEFGLKTMDELLGDDDEEAGDGE